MRLLHSIKRYAPTEEKAPHSHDDFVQLFYIHQGCGIARTKNKSILAVGGQLIWVPFNHQHHLKVLKDSCLSIIHASPDAIPYFHDEMGIISTNSLMVQVMAEIESQDISCEQDPDSNCDIQHHYLAVFLDQLKKQSYQNDAYQSNDDIDKRLLPIIEALTLQPDIKLSLERFSDHCGASSRTLNRLFISTFDKPFREIRQQLVMEKAWQLSRAGVTHTDIALDLGYNSLSAFSHAFNRFKQDKANKKLAKNHNSLASVQQR
ncbi:MULTISPECIES: helix-turn-helix domain-containing protein [unclassified Photobacterium]|uniref:helix-turn-helix domain-containing protein n=1 Tax=unclassified Photobacterium TaxID=2628852 RepID=UPI001EDFB9A0|nr:MULTISPECIES: helix-turn-helix domain-containing protein [unclassified Photobacterium]MCG3863243.1 helix-turn-helix transcriptional regulator [Photobacterium sp. Ph6]MCG3874773.1 helix-turn-helix transcriptional regulator [Photobacterium sp. Ph5]